MKKIKGLILCMSVIVIIFSIALVADASARDGTSPGIGWNKRACDNGCWYVKDKDALIGSNYYSSSYDYSKAWVQDGKGNYMSSGWRLQDEAYAARKRTATGNSAKYYYKD